MAETGTTWGVARTRLDGSASSPFEWQGPDHAWPNQEDAEFRAKSGSLMFSEPSDFREPHPKVAGAVLLIERFFVFLVYPIRGGDQTRCAREAIDGVSVGWLESLRPTDGGRPSSPPGSGGSPQLAQMNAILQAQQAGREGEISPEIDAAFQALHAQMFEGRFGDSVAALWQAAGPAYRGVECAFFRNVIECKFTGTEHRLAIERYLRGLVNFNRPAMQGTDLPLMARFIVDQTGDGRPRLGRTNIAGLDLDRFLDDALATAMAIGTFEGLTVDDLAMRLRGAAARYQMGMD
ncbi:hypothetical protein AB0C96_39020 [Streptomyces sp. NPDC048506]|uniref:hypothetical protein n=1 Tax=Streptomyces sp. NPDC048506 TaxID=3155028 RepID=UPI003413DD4B